MQLVIRGISKTYPNGVQALKDVTLTIPPGVTRVLATSFTSVWRRSLAFHLAQARLSFQCFREIGRLLRERSPRSQ